MHFSRDVENLIANLRGLPEDESKSRPREVCGIASLIEVLAERHKIGRSTQEDVLMQHWREIVGEKNAHRTRPHKLVEGRKLIILVANAVVRQELEFNKRQIINRLKAWPECAQIEEISLRAG